MEKIINFSKEKKIKFINELKNFCSQPSIAAQNLGMEKMAKMVEKKLKRIGAKTKIVKTKKSFPYILAEIKSNHKNAKTVLIYNHYDVQPADEKKWSTKPFEPIIKNGKIFARGTSDNKANMLLRIQAIEIWKNIHGDLPINIKWIIEGEEEIGSPNINELSKKHSSFWKNADVCVWETGGTNENSQPKLNLGMKGVIDLRLILDLNKSDIHSADAIIFENPIWRLINALKTMRDENGNITIDGFYKNALRPTKEEKEIIKKIKFDVEKYKKDTGAKITLKEKNKEKLLEKMFFKSTLNINGIFGGDIDIERTKTILPQMAYAKVDIRTVVNQKNDEIIKKIRRHLDKKGFKDIEIKKMASLEPSRSSINNIFVKKCIDALEKIHKKKTEVQITSLAGGPIYSVAGKHNIPTIEIGCGNSKSNAHGPNENIKINDYFKAIEVFIEYINSL